MCEIALKYLYLALEPSHGSLIVREHNLVGEGNNERISSTSASVSYRSLSLSVPGVINSEVIPSNGPVFDLSAMMSSAANQHVVVLEEVCALVSEGVGW